MVFVRIATWNINSVRLRLDLVLRALDEIDPDILFLQETKVPDHLFPEDRFRERGYTHIARAGMKGYNGVAILSRLPLDDIRRHDWCGQSDARHIAARTTDDIDIHCVYIPSGGDTPDPDTNPKFAHKLQFVDDMTAWWPDIIGADSRAVLLGDLNIAPLENDVWSHKQMLNVVSHTPAEVERLTAMAGSVGWVDAVRHFVPSDKRLYSWWSYRARDWATSNRGRRLDHIWVTPALANGLKDTGILTQARGWPPKPSDHVPVWVDLTP